MGSFSLLVYNRPPRFQATFTLDGVKEIKCGVQASQSFKGDSSMMRLFSCVALAGLVFLTGQASATTQPIDPPAPAGGFPIATKTNTITYTDGYLALVEVNYPDPGEAQPGPCGWPAIVLVHQLRQNRFNLRTLARDFARKGYFSITYDVRGQGPSMNLNDPDQYGFTGMGLRERIDLAEVIERTSDLFPISMDPSRLAVEGRSQGGIHAWVAAAHSGKFFPPNPWRNTRFPTISCIVTSAFPPDLAELCFPRGKTINTRVLKNLFFDHPSLVIDPMTRAIVEEACYAEDFSAIHAAASAPGIDLPTLLRQTSVPMLARMGYDDQWGPPDSALRIFSTLQSDTPVRLLLDSGGHGVPSNEQHTGQFRRIRYQWFDRFLKGIENGVENEKPMRLGIVPEQPHVYRNQRSLWDFHEQDLTTGDDFIRGTFYLRAGGLLSTEAPVTGETHRQIIQTNVSGLTMNTFSQRLPHPAQLMEAIPLSTCTYDSEPFVADRHIVGLAKVDVSIDCQQTAFQLHCALLDVSPDGDERYISGGQITERDSTPGERRVSVDISLHSQIIRKGHRVRLQIENLVWHRPPMEEPLIRFAPIFEEFEVSILSTPSHAPSLEVGFLPTSTPTLVSSDPLGAISERSGYDFAIHSDSSKEGWRVALLISMSGRSPGSQTNSGYQIPINVDTLTRRALKIAPGAPFQDFIGVLDANGSAFPSLILAAPIVPRAMDFDLAAVIYQQGQLEVTNAIRLLYR